MMTSLFSVLKIKNGREERITRAMSGYVAFLLLLIDGYGTCCHQRPCTCQWSGLLPETMLMARGHIDTAKNCIVRAN